MATQPTVPATAIQELKAWLRIATTDEDALLVSQLGAAILLCEHFTGRVLLRRTIIEAMPAHDGWQALQLEPVVSIALVEASVSGANFNALDIAAYELEVDSTGQGLVRVIAATNWHSLQIHYVAGLAENWGELPEPLRQGVIRLAAHLYTTRDGGDGAIPAAASALWRPWRKWRL